MPRAEAEQVLSRLGFQERASDSEGASWAVPSWRVDVSLEEDLIEELVRTKGYDIIPETLPSNAVEHAGRAGRGAGARVHPGRTRGGPGSARR